MKKINYLGRILSSYLFSKNSKLTFWHEIPEVNYSASIKELGQYYMTFAGKANYQGLFDKQGIPLLDYHGKVGKQYNPIAIAQYALANYNLAISTGNKIYRHKFLSNADWLRDNLVETPQGTYLWPHNFDFEYFRPLNAPWFSGLAQGQGLSVLVRASAESTDPKYHQAMEQVFQSLTLLVERGGVLFQDDRGYVWIEEYLVDPPTHILNGFIWALWGVYDYYLFTKKAEAKELFEDCTATILEYLHRYNLGFWSLYELTPQPLKSIASPYYHRLHIAQLSIMHRLTGQPRFAQYAEKWERFSRNILFQAMALSYKIVFKIAYY